MTTDDKNQHTDSHLNQTGGLTTTRIQALSDGVFSIAMTLLILQVAIPHHLTALELKTALINLWPQIISYIVSFMVLAVFWIGHHNQFTSIKFSDRTFLWINIFFLMSVAFIPFSTALFGDYNNQHLAILIYGGNLIITGIFLYWHWWYATKNHRLVAADLDHKIIAIAKFRILIGIIFYMVAIAVSFVSIKTSIVMFVILPVLYMKPSRIDKLLSS